MGRNHKYRRGKKSSNRSRYVSTGTIADKTPILSASISSTFAVLNDSGSVYTDIISIDDNKRLKACRILSNFLAQYNRETFEKIVMHDILSRLVMRVVDHNIDVKCEALIAIRNLSAFDMNIVSQRLLECNALEACLTLVNDINLDSITSLDMKTLSIIEHLLLCLCNMLSCHSEITSKYQQTGLSSVTKILSIYTILLPSFLESSYLKLNNNNYEMIKIFEIVNLLSDFLLIATDSMININQHFIQKKLLSNLLDMLLFIETKLTHLLSQITTIDFRYHYYNLYLKTVNIIFNILEKATMYEIQTYLFTSNKISNTGSTETILESIQKTLSHILNILTPFMSTTESSLTISNELNSEKGFDIYNELKNIFVKNDGSGDNIHNKINEMTSMIVESDSTAHVTTIPFISNDFTDNSLESSTNSVMIMFLSTLMESVHNIAFILNTWSELLNDELQKSSNPTVENKKILKKNSISHSADITTDVMKNMLINFTSLNQVIYHENQLVNYLYFINNILEIIQTKSNQRTEKSVLLEIQLLEVLDHCFINYNNIFTYLVTAITTSTVDGHTNKKSKTKTISSNVYDNLLVKDCISICMKLIECQFHLIETPSPSPSTSVSHDDNNVTNHEENKHNEYINIRSLLEASIKVSISAYDCLNTICHQIPSHVWKEISTPTTATNNISTQTLPFSMQSFVLFLCKSVTFSSPWIVSSITSSEESVDCLNTVSNNILFDIIIDMNQITGCAIECISTLTLKDNDVYNDSPNLLSIHNTEGYILSVKYNALFSNAIIRKLESLEKLYIEPLLKFTKKQFLSNDTTTTPLDTMLQKMIPTNLVLMNLSLGCLIDLHSSDHMGILQNYVGKMKLHDKIQDMFQIFKQYYNSYINIYNKNSSCNKIENSDFKECILESEQIQSIDECFDNLVNFIEYKSDMIQNNNSNSLSV